MRHVRSAALAAFALVVIALVAFARPPAPAALSAPYTTLDLSHGPTLLKAPGTLHLNLAANYFGPGSPAFNGDVACTGTVLKTSGAYELGSTTLVLERINNASIDYPMSGGPVPIYARVVEFGLASSSPIQFTVSGQSQSWNVTAELATTWAPAVEHDISRTADTSGTFSGAIKIPLIVKFTRGATTKTLDLGVVELACSSGTWTTIATSNTSGLAVPQFNLGVALTGTFSSSSLDLNVVPAQVNPNRPGATSIDGTATVSGSVATIGRYCTIGAGAVIDAGVVIGPHANIGANVHVYPNAVVADYASIASGSTVGTGAFVGSSCSVGSGCTISSGATICDLGSILGGTSIGADTFIQRNSSISTNCTIGSGCNIGEDVTIGSGATVNADLLIFHGATIAASSTQSTNISLATYEDGTTALLDWPPAMAPTSTSPFSIGNVGEFCDPADAVVAPDAGDIKNGTTSSSGHLTDDGGFLTLPDDIGNDVAAYPGGQGPVCDGIIFACSWYCEKLQSKLAIAGYETTFTIVHVLSLTYKWTGRGPKWKFSHSLTDIHWSDGKITWVDAQFPYGTGIDPLVDGHELDDNNDGHVTYVEGKVSDDLTDGDLRIEVWSSRAEAEAAYGQSFPGGHYGF